METNIILVKSNNFIGKQIRKITDSKYNHIGIFIKENKIIESSFTKGVIITSFDKYKEQAKNNKLSFDIYKFKKPILEKEWSIARDYLLKQVGNKYDIMQVISLFIFFMLHINRKNVEPIDIEKAFICSELIGKACDKINIKFTEEVDLDNLTPKDIETSDIIEKII